MQIAQAQTQAHTISMHSTNVQVHSLLCKISIVCVCIDDDDDTMQLCVCVPNLKATSSIELAHIEPASQPIALNVETYKWQNAIKFDMQRGCKMPVLLTKRANPNEIRRK